MLSLIPITKTLKCIKLELLNNPSRKPKIETPHPQVKDIKEVCRDGSDENSVAQSMMNELGTKIQSNKLNDQYNLSY